MKIILLGLLFLLCFDLQAGIRKSKLKVLYVGGSSDVYANINRGKVDSALLLEGAKKRTVAFEKLLKQYFKYVTAIDAKDYQPVLSEDYDVTVMDGLPQPIVPPTTQEDPSLDFLCFQILLTCGNGDFCFHSVFNRLFISVRKINIFNLDTINHHQMCIRDRPLPVEFRHA